MRKRLQARLGYQSFSAADIGGVRRNLPVRSAVAERGAHRLRITCIRASD